MHNKYNISYERQTNMEALTATHTSSHVCERSVYVHWDGEGKNH